MRKLITGFESSSYFHFRNLDKSFLFSFCSTSPNAGYSAIADQSDCCSELFLSGGLRCNGRSHLSDQNSQRIEHWIARCLEVELQIRRSVPAGTTHSDALHPFDRRSPCSCQRIGRERVVQKPLWGQKGLTSQHPLNGKRFNNLALFLLVSLEVTKFLAFGKFIRDIPN